MSALDEALLAELRAGVTVLVPTAQRAAAVRLSHARAMIRAGAALWPTPDVLPWHTWLERLLRRAVLAGETSPHAFVPSRAQQRALWKEAVLTAGNAASELAPTAFAEALQSATRVRAEWELPLSSQQGFDEAALLTLATDHVVTAAARLRALVPDLLPQGLLEGVLAREGGALRLLFAGFAATTARQRRVAAAVRAAGGEVRVHRPTSPAPCAVQVLTALDVQEECEQAAAWCREQLGGDPGRRLLILAPQLQRIRPALQRALDEALRPASLLQAGTLWGGAVDPLVAFEGGDPLARVPLVASALQALAFLAPSPEAPATMPFEDVSALLRSSFLSPGPERAAARDRLDLWLRGQPATGLSCGMLRRALLAAPRGLAEEAAALGAALEGAVRALAGSGSAPPSSWPARCSEALAAFGWPGTQALTSHEQQTLERWDELLAELAQLDEVVGPLEAAGAVATLRELAQASDYQPLSGDAAVTVSRSLDDPIASYDAIWAMGLSSVTWPAPVRPDAFVPLGLQVAAGRPQASSAARLAEAREQLAAWRRCARHLTLSWHGSELLEALSASPLLAPAELGGQVAAASRRPALALATLLAPAPQLERIDDTRGLPFGGAVLRGGAGTLQKQADCPFRGHAELRLAAGPFETPRSGLDRLRRGNLLHHMLEALWRELQDSRALQALAPPGVESLLERAYEQAERRLRTRTAVTWPAALLARERERALRLVRELIDLERGRAPFRCAATEHEATLAPDGGPALRLRIDRVDALADGTLVLLDYKTGEVDSRELTAELPRPVQLPAYASVAMGAAVSAVAFVQVARDRVGFQGCADRGDRLPGVTAVEREWAEQLQRWRARIEQLLGEIREGFAPVLPVTDLVCRNCHLPMLCRIESLSAGEALRSGE